MIRTGCISITKKYKMPEITAALKFIKMFKILSRLVSFDDLSYVAFIMKIQSTRRSRKLKVYIPIVKIAEGSSFKDFKDLFSQKK